MRGSAFQCGLSKRLHARLMAWGSPGFDKMVAARKRALFASLAGTVLEIGPGTGPNLNYYPKNIRWIGIEPNVFMHRYLRAEAERLGFSIELRTGSAEPIEVGDGSVDAVVTTLVLCSVRDIDRALKEIMRVLTPGGKFYFLEHVAAPPGTGLRRLQGFLRPIWKTIADGCHPDRETGVALRAAGFRQVEYDDFRVAVPVVGTQIAGVAVK